MHELAIRQIRARPRSLATHFLFFLLLPQSLVPPLPTTPLRPQLMAFRGQAFSSHSSTSSLLAKEMKLDDTHRLSSWSSSIHGDSPYSAGANSRLPSISDKFSLSPDPRTWGADLSPNLVEEDDALHDPQELLKRDGRGKRIDRAKLAFYSNRGFLNLGCLLILIFGLLALFAGYPIIHYVKSSPVSRLGAYNLGGVNASGQVPTTWGNVGLIDVDTPKEAYTKTSYHDGKELTLVFSDEFNVDGRTFYPGDDPYWEAVDLHYWPTNNMEWYDPAAITTLGGSLVITLEEKETHGLHYQGGMMSTWNKFCFTGGYIEANVSLPGISTVMGLWPAIWTMGNLGRAGYGATLDGMWPYTYDSCDVGTVANQTYLGQPVAALSDGDYSTGRNGTLSLLPGQRLSRCTCEGESHPGPKHSDGTYVGRSAPEIDMFEAQISNNVGQVSQSAQWAPFNWHYFWYNTTENMVIPNTSISAQNSYIGGATQQATSVVTSTNQICYEYEEGCYTTYGFEYLPGFDNAYVTWVATATVSWTLNVAGLAADPIVNISSRPVPQEPMYILANLGMSTNFGTVDTAHIPFPVHMYIDYIRVYQHKDAMNIGCDPKDFPTAAYIEQYSEAYTNPNITGWGNPTAGTGGLGYNQSMPRNSFLGQC